MSAQPPHKSSLAQHPDVKEVLPRFVARLPGHVQRLGELQAAGDTPQLLHLVHQLRGTGKSYGFSGMSELAAAAEDRMLAGATAADVASLVQDLIAYLRHVEGYSASP